MADLSELFARDPLDLTKPDISLIIEEMRKRRGQFVLGNMKAGSSKPLTEKAKSANSLAEKLGLKLDL